MVAVAVLGSLMVLVTGALVPLAILARQMTVGGALGTLLITIPAAAIGMLIAWRRLAGHPRPEPGHVIRPGGSRAGSH